MNQLELFKIPGLNQKQSNFIYFIATVLGIFAGLSFLARELYTTAILIVIIKVGCDFLINRYREQNKKENFDTTTITPGTK